MPSLKSFIPIISEIIGLSPIAIYERQRALIRAQLLPTPIGRGRGNGLPATPATVAWLLIAMMATDNLSETDKRLKKWATSKFSSLTAKRCDLTGKRSFLTAITTVLGSTELASAVQVVEVSRVTAFSSIVFQKKEGYQVSQFGKPLFERLYFDVDAKMSGRVFQLITEALQAGDE